MAEDLTKTIAALEHKNRVLEEENAQLAEMAVDSLLLGLISDNIQNPPLFYPFCHRPNTVNIICCPAYDPCCKPYSI